MDPIAQDSTPNQLSPDQLTPPTIQPAPKPSILPIVIFIFLIISLAGVGALTYQNTRLQQQITAIKLQPIAKPTPTPTSDPTGNWKTYTNVSDGYLLKYPDDWIVQTLTDVKDKFYSFDALGKEMILSKTILRKNGYQMIIFRNFSGPISEEPQICVYPDSQIDSGTYAPLRFTSDMVTEIRDGGYRRSILNEYPDQIRFEVCKPRENPSAGGIIFQPAYVTYLTPKKYDLKTLSEMDQILSTFKLIDQDKIFCGGIAGVICPEAYGCKYDNNYPDASGVCTKNFENGTLEAKVVRSPTCAGPVTGQENCEGPYANGTLKIISLPGNEDIQTINTDKDGAFTISLAPGSYNLQNTESGIGKNIRNPSFTIAGGKTTIQRFDIDTGIR